MTLSVGLFLCSLTNINHENNTSVAFRQFIKKFRQLQLPVTLHYGEFESMNLPVFDSQNIDTLFIKDNDTIDKYYGILPDTNNYFGLIILYPAGYDYYPILITFDKIGNKISEEHLLNRGCGFAPGLDYCSSTGVINRDMTIYLADTLKTVKLDSTMKPIDSTREYFCLYINGKINNSGKITMTGEQTKNIK